MPIIEEDKGRRRCALVGSGGKYGELAAQIERGNEVFVEFTDLSRVEGYPKPETGMRAALIDIEEFEYPNPVYPQPSGFLPVIKLWFNMQGFERYNRLVGGKSLYPTHDGNETNCFLDSSLYPQNGVVRLSCFGTYDAEPELFKAIGVKLSH